MKRKSAVKLPKPIAFSPAMSQAIRDGLKTMTRRVIRVQPKIVDGAWYWKHNKYDNGMGANYFHTQKISDDILEGMAACNPYGSPGDLLYVKEEHWIWGLWEETGERTSSGQKKLKFNSDRSEITFSRPSKTDCANRDGSNYGWAYRNARYMNRSTSRIMLRITCVDVEQVNQISDLDARREGARPVPGRERGETLWSMGGDSLEADSPIGAFRYYWDQLNSSRNMCQECDGRGFVVKFNSGVPRSIPCAVCSAVGIHCRPYSWEGNPFVDVIEFEVLETK